MKAGFKSAIVSVILCVMAVSSQAGYQISTQVERIDVGYRYTWSVYNVDQGHLPPNYAGLVNFHVLVPAATPVLGVTVPPPGSPPAPDSGWGFWELYGAITDGVGAVLCPAPPAGFKWLRYAGGGWGSVYPPDTTAVFSFTTDASTVPGNTDCNLVTFWAYDLLPLTHYSALFDTTVGPTAVPEPSSLVAFLCGVSGLGGLAFVRSKK